MWQKFSTLRVLPRRGDRLAVFVVDLTLPTYDGHVVIGNFDSLSGSSDSFLVRAMKVGNSNITELHTFPNFAYVMIDMNLTAALLAQDVEESLI